MIGVVSGSNIGRDSINPSGDYFNAIAIITNVKTENAIYKVCMSCRKFLWNLVLRFE